MTPKSLAIGCLTDTEVVLGTKIPMEQEFGQSQKHWTTQIWRRGQSNEEGWFHLQNPTTGKFLTARGEEKLTIEGSQKRQFK